MEPQRMYGRKKVAVMVGMTLRQLDRWVNEGRFPKPHLIGKRTIRWFADEILEWQVKARLGLLGEDVPKK